MGFSYFLIRNFKIKHFGVPSFTAKLNLTNLITKELIVNTFINIQNELKVPKSEFNSFGKYKYRTVEAILESAKKVCFKYSALLNLSDEVILVGERYYVKSTAKLILPDGLIIQSFGYARESESKKGMNEAQITGSSSSYARKRALEGLFGLDDSVDVDAINSSIWQEIYNLIESTGTDKLAICAAYKVKELEDITDTTKLLNQLKSKLKT